MIPVYNEEDIIQEVIEHLISQGLDLVVLDNGSTDGTYEICKKFAEKGLLELSKFKTKTYDNNWDLILRALYDLALTKKPDWVIRSDSDEILESGIRGVPLKDAISKVDAEGYNLIQFDIFNFFSSDNDNVNAKSVIEKFPYYKWRSDFAYRAWKFMPGINVEYSGGHYPVFPDEYCYKIYPKKFVLRHYGFRGEEQVKKKLKGKTRGIDYRKTKEGLAEYTLNMLKGDYGKKVDHNLLTKYEENEKWNLEFKDKKQNAQRKEEIFSKDGKLLIPHKTHRELQIQLWYLQKNNFAIKFLSKVSRTKKSIQKKLKKFGILK